MAFRILGFQISCTTICLSIHWLVNTSGCLQFGTVENKAATNRPGGRRQGAHAPKRRRKSKGSDFCQSKVPEWERFC